MKQLLKQRRRKDEVLQSVTKAFRQAGDEHHLQGVWQANASKPAAAEKADRNRAGQEKPEGRGSLGSRFELAAARNKRENEEQQALYRMEQALAAQAENTRRQAQIESVMESRGGLAPNKPLVSGDSGGSRMLVILKLKLGWPVNICFLLSRMCFARMRLPPSRLQLSRLLPRATMSIRIGQRYVGCRNEVTGQCHSLTILLSFSLTAGAATQAHAGN